MKRAMQKSEGASTASSYLTITIDELLLFFYPLKDPAYIDSRVLFHFMSSSLVDCDVKLRYADWLTFAFEMAGQGILPFCALDVQGDNRDNIFFMLTTEQAYFLILYTQYPHLPSIQQLEPIFHKFLRKNEGRKLIDAWPAAMYLCSKLNKTLEELQEEDQKGTKRQKEKSIENALSTQLKQSGMAVQQQVRCSAGIADIVTPDAIYEIKAELSLHTLRQAIAQVLAYRVYINPDAKAYIVGCKPKKEDVAYELAVALGVEIIIWDDISK